VNSEDRGCLGSVVPCWHS